MKTYKCAYKYCVHNFEPINEDSAISVGRQKYHWDCLAIKQKIDELRKMYINQIDPNTNFPVISKVLNDLVFKYNQDLDYIQFALEYYINTKTKIKSPFTLLYLRNNDLMKKKWELRGGDTD